MNNLANCIISLNPVRIALIPNRINKSVDNLELHVINMNPLVKDNTIEKNK